MTNDEFLPNSSDDSLELVSTRVSGPLAARDPAVGLRELASLAARAVGSNSHCGITVTSPIGLTETIASSDDLPIRMDWLQRELKQGPRIGSDQNTSTLVISDFTTEVRWVEFARLCAHALGLRSMLSIQMPCSGGRAVMNIYSSMASAFTAQQVDVAARFARMAAPAVEVHLRNANNDARPNVSSTVITALGIVMARYRLNSPDAFMMLKNASRDLDRELFALASEVVRDGRLPAREINRARRERHARAGSNSRGQARAGEVSRGDREDRGDVRSSGEGCSASEVRGDYDHLQRVS